MGSKKNQKSKLPELRVNGKFCPDDDIETDDVANGVVRNVPRAWLSPPGLPHIEANSVEQLRDVNRQLVTHIEVLNYKTSLDLRQRDTVVNHLLESSKEVLTKKDVEIEHLKSDLQEKDENLKALTEENHKKNREVIQYDKYVADLEKEVQASKAYAHELHCQLEQIPKMSALNGQQISEHNNQVLELRTEIDTMKRNLTTLEKELALANEKIANQGRKIQLMETERGKAEIRFNENIEAVKRTMRNEIERLREVMTQQWKEMSELRNQGEVTKQYIKEIRDFLVAWQNPKAAQVPTQEVIRRNNVTPNPAPKQTKGNRKCKK